MKDSGMLTTNWILFLSFTLIAVLFSMALFLFQNSKERLGGKIASAKGLWLFFCIYCWLIFIPYICHFDNIPLVYYKTWMCFFYWFLARSVIEMAMMFLFKNWTPPIGIIHDLSCLIILVIGPYIFEVEGGNHLFWYDFFNGILIFSVVMETYYAYTFYKIVGLRTKGEHAIWYASNEDQSFKQVVKITALANIPLYLGLIFFIGFLIFNSNL